MTSLSWLFTLLVVTLPGSDADRRKEQAKAPFFPQIPCISLVLTPEEVAAHGQVLPAMIAKLRHQEKWQIADRLETLALQKTLALPMTIRETKDGKIFYEMSLRALFDLEVTSASLTLEKQEDAPSNIIVIPAKIIEERAYTNLTMVLRDLPGYDFLMGDENGETPTFSRARGFGGNGNIRILIMVDGIPQNDISFLWSYLWSDEALFVDLDRIEVIQGPGSSLYGAQAFTGVINLITKEKYQGLHIRTTVGAHETKAVDLHYGRNLGSDWNLSLAIKKWEEEGDNGDRTDPGGFYHGNVFPYTTTQDYDPQGNYVEGASHPQAGQPIPDGFNTFVDVLALRLKLNTAHLEWGLNYWDDKHGNSSWVSGYEYVLRDPRTFTRRTAYHLYGKHQWHKGESLSLESQLVFRTNAIDPESGFVYSYRFPDRPKRPHAFSSQTYFEEKLTYAFSEHQFLICSLRTMHSAKGEYIYSFDGKADAFDSGTDFSWDEAVAGNGIGLRKEFSRKDAFETAAGILWNRHWYESFRSSIGVRYDHSSEFGETVNPRLGLIFKPLALTTIKLMYGTAFRQPSVFETRIEVYRNPNLKPEEIETSEIELSLNFDLAHLRMNLFHEHMTEAIQLVTNPNADPNGFSDLWYENVGTFSVRGLSFLADFQPADNVRLYANYAFTEGKDAIGPWQEIEYVSRHKANAGLHWSGRYLDLDWRANWVGKRRAPAANTWIQREEQGYGPAFTLANLTLTYKGWQKWKPQLVVANMFDRAVYGLGRGGGSADTANYDPETNINPPGFVGAYHPWEGRSWRLNLSYRP